MTDIIVIFVVFVLLGLALRGTVKHFKGEGSCCGGGHSDTCAKQKKKKLSNPVLGTKVVRIAGMHCDHCVQSVTHAIEGIDGAIAKVILKEEIAIVSYDRPLDDALLRHMVESVGFQVRSIE